MTKLVIMQGKGKYKMAALPCEKEVDEEVVKSSFTV